MTLSLPTLISLTTPKRMNLTTRLPTLLAKRNAQLIAELTSKGLLK